MGTHWKAAWHNELTALGGNQTFDPPGVPPKGVNIVSSRWVFAVKHNPDGTVNKFKARIVARGFSQKYGIDFEETFAPTVRHDTLRIFMAIVAQMDLECHQVDVNNAFTESTLQEEIWMEPPDGMSVLPGQKVKVRRSLYRLKQAARDRNVSANYRRQNKT
jgi:Reverse transcriptase (RNA-dependent DNA polymerase).